MEFEGERDSLSSSSSSSLLCILHRDLVVRSASNRLPLLRGVLPQARIPPVPYNPPSRSHRALSSSIIMLSKPTLFSTSSTPISPTANFRPAFLLARVRSPRVISVNALANRMYIYIHTSYARTVSSGYILRVYFYFSF